MWLTYFSIQYNTLQGVFTRKKLASLRASDGLCFICLYPVWPAGHSVTRTNYAKVIDFQYVTTSRLISNLSRGFLFSSNSERRAEMTGVPNLRNANVVKSSYNQATNSMMSRHCKTIQRGAISWDKLASCECFLRLSLPWSKTFEFTNKPTLSSVMKHPVVFHSLSQCKHASLSRTEVMQSFSDKNLCS